MGCDIHMHTERFANGRWEHVADGPYDDRNYDLYWVLGENPRRPGPNPPIGAYRGVPEDASLETKRDAGVWGSDGHSHTWLSLAELQRWIERYPSQREVDESSFWSRDIEKLLAIDARPEHVRIVFWFDN